MKSLKNLLIPFIVLIVLVIGLVFWAVAKPKDKDDDESEEISNYDILYVNPIDIDNLEVTGGDIEAMKVLVQEDPQAESGFTYTYASSDADSAINYSQNALRSYVSMLTNFTGSSKIEAPSDLSEYGLDTGYYLVTINRNDGTAVKIHIGSQTYDNSGCYMQVEGDPDVYITANLKLVYAAYQSINFLETSLLSIDYSKINTVEFVRLSDNVRILADCEVDSETGEPFYNVKEPYEIKASAYFENLVEYIATLDISEFMNIADDELADYGLDNPNYTFTFTMDSGEVITVALSSSIGGYYYGSCTGVDNYFMLSEIQIEGLDTPILTLLSSYVAYYNSSELTKVTAVYEDRSFEFELDVASGKSISDDSSSVQLNLRDAKVFDSNGRSYAAVVFESVACVEIGGIDTEAAPDYDPVLTLTFYTKTYDTKVVDFVTRDANSYYVFINGKYSSFYVYANELFNDGGTDTYSYGAWSAFELADEAISNQSNGVYDIK